MRALVADNDRSTTAILTQTIEGWGLDVLLARDGRDAWNTLEQDSGIALAVLARNAPEIDGLELCRRIRRHEQHADLYVLLVTARDNRADLAACLDAGVDDYLGLPLDPLELRARVNTALRVVTFQERLMENVLTRARRESSNPSLDALLAVCSYCKSVRPEGEAEWEELERYLAQRANAQVSHGVCPACYEAVIQRLK